MVTRAEIEQFRSQRGTKTDQQWADCLIQEWDKVLVGDFLLDVAKFYTNEAIAAHGTRIKRKKGPNAKGHDCNNVDKNITRAVKSKAEELGVDAATYRAEFDKIRLANKAVTRTQSQRALQPYNIPPNPDFQELATVYKAHHGLVPLEFWVKFYLAIQSAGGKNASKGRVRTAFSHRSEDSTENLMKRVEREALRPDGQVWDWANIPQVATTISAPAPRAIPPPTRAPAFRVSLALPFAAPTNLPSLPLLVPPPQLAQVARPVPPPTQAPAFQVSLALPPLPLPPGAFSFQPPTSIEVDPDEKNGHLTTTTTPSGFREIPARVRRVYTELKDDPAKFHVSALYVYDKYPDEVDASRLHELVNGLDDADEFLVKFGKEEACRRFAEAIERWIGQDRALPSRWYSHIEGCLRQMWSEYELQMGASFAASAFAAPAVPRWRSWED